MFKPENIKNAWKYIRSNPAAGGIDNMTIADFDSESDIHCQRILEKLNKNVYLPEAYLQIEIPKSKTENRILGLPTIYDKIVQQAIRMKIEGKLEHTFFNSSYAYREGKGAYKAINRINHIIQQEKQIWIAKCDIDNFFDNINHLRLITQLRPFITDDYIVQLILMFCRMGYVSHHTGWHDRSKGVPQGAILSPLLANLYLTPLDQRMEDRNIHYVRYADDFVILSDSEENAKMILDETIKYIRSHLMLELNEGAFVRHTQYGFKFLGIWITNEGNFLHPDKLTKLKEKLADSIFHKNFPKKYHEQVAGIVNYYSRIIPEYVLFPLDDHIKKLAADLIVKTTGLRSKKGARNILKDIRFVTNQYESNKTFILNEIINSVFTIKNPDKPISADKAVKIRKREYELKATEHSHIILTGYGKNLGVSKKEITVRSKGRVEQKFPTNNLRQITIATEAANISAKLIEFAVKRKIPIDFVNQKGEPTAKIFSPDVADFHLWAMQAAHVGSDKGIITAISIVCAKIDNMIKLIKYFSKYAVKNESDIRDSFRLIIESLNDNIRQAENLNNLDREEFRMQLIGIEGIASSAYWGWVKLMIDEESTFPGRIRQGATDLVNALLNYGYSILYRLVWTSVLSQGLNPSFSYVHKPRTGEGTLIFDLIETFRQPVVDRAVISLIDRGTKLEIKNGKLSETTVQKLIKAVNKRLGRYDTYLRERLNYYDIISKQTLMLVKNIEGTEKKFRPYQLSKW